MRGNEVEICSYLPHIPTEISEEIEEYVTNVVLKYSRYLFVSRSKAGQQYAYCTHCRKQSKTDGLKHNYKAVCELCGSECTVKQSGRGRKYLFDNEHFIWFEKSAVDPKRSIVARGFSVTRDYSGDYRETKTNFKWTAAYVFRPGDSWMGERYWWNKNGGWYQRTTIFEYVDSQNYTCFYSKDNIINAVKGTPFQYSTWEEYGVENSLKVFDLAAKYPCIEYLTKMGLTDIVEAKIHRGKTYGVINWRGKTPEKVLRMSRQDLKRIQKTDVRVDPFTLYLFQQAKKDGSNFTIEEAHELAKAGNAPLIKKLKSFTTLRKISSYIRKQFERKNPNGRRYYTAGSVLVTWTDYLRDCRKLDMDTTQEVILFPTNLHKAHRETIKKVEYYADLALNAKFEKRYKKLSAYTFRRGAYIIRPAKSSQELIAEGNALIHCVGGYAEKHANGETSIFVMRKVSDPEKPFYTVEVKNNKITQAYGYDNQVPTKGVQKFLDSFAAQMLAKRTNKKATRSA